MCHKLDTYPIFQIISSDFYVKRGSCHDSDLEYLFLLSFVIPFISDGLRLAEPISQDSNTDTCVVVYVDMYDIHIYLCTVNTACCWS